MSRGFPSMTALLGLLAVAGYQNRDKIAEMLGGLAKGTADPTSHGQSPGAGAQQGGLGGLLSGLGSAGVGGLLSGGVSELVDRFTQAGHGETAKSWVDTAPNRTIEPTHLEQAIGPDVIATLTRQTGLSRDELLARLSRDLPGAIDQYTPDGRLPSHA
ncbi:YidB family protein [Methylobacterium sp. J-090]|uniref:YidB family protein n=1 Tax=Methylobacterium sp. J-090 TaxID=2836666 RepID=UPI001FBA130A|nr:YidB family protein [Methylobacterium sp. J-090]MCJ2082861.1 YidB family protein [Methylobacterium sp. J-090]